MNVKEVWLSWSTKTRILVSILIFLIIQLNFYFAWTSKAFHHNILVSYEIYNFAKLQLTIPPLRSYFVNWAMPICENNPSFCFANGCNNTLTCFTYDMATRFFIDCETVAFTVLIFCLSLSLFYRKGIMVAVLRAFEITSATILPLGLEMWIFDRSEFQVQTSVIQISTRFAWFTNADLLYISSLVFFLTIMLEGFRYARTKHSGPEFKFQNKVA